MIETATILREIRTLLDASASGDPADAEVVERVLTNGYAHALLLESERLRIEDRLRTVVRGGARGRRAREELARLTVELAGADEELASLRGLLTTARARTLS